MDDQPLHDRERIANLERRSDAMAKAIDRICACPRVGLSYEDVYDAQESKQGYQDEPGG